MINIKTAQYIRNEFTNKIITIKIIDTDDVLHFVPIDEANTDYQNILQWVADGNTIQEAD